MLRQSGYVGEKQRQDILDNERNMFVQVILLSQMRKCDVVEGNDRRGKPVNIFEIEA